MIDDLISRQDSLVHRTESRRVFESVVREPEQRELLGQFFTPAPVAALLAEAFERRSGLIRVLDPGAGVGSLTAALVNRTAAEGWRSSLHVTAVEMDEGLLPSLRETLHECEGSADVTTRIVGGDFIDWACCRLDRGLFAGEPEFFDFAILNPPYRKLNTATRERRMLSEIGIEATNLYAAFVALSLRLLSPGGQLVAITPRSFCNGPYFKAFRKELLGTASLNRIHLFDSRDLAFRDTSVLQENVIVHLVKGGDQKSVVISSSGGEAGGASSEREVAFGSVVHDGDKESFIRIVSDVDQCGVADSIGSLPCTLASAGFSVSTGRVVDFRSKDNLRADPEAGSVPLIYPAHLRGGRVRWPILGSKKANALAVNNETRNLLLPMGNYVLVKRFSSKEERRRVVATVLEVVDLPYDFVAIENHVNVVHVRNAGLELVLARGLATFLNSTVVDMYFRQFNGHTQVNATDLRSLRYPSVLTLSEMGGECNGNALDQATIDSIIDRHVLTD